MALQKVLEYNTTERIFTKKEYDATAGNTASNSQVFHSNRWIDNEMEKIQYFVYATPLYTTVGGTTNYYLQDVNSVFTNLARPFIRFTFSANTESFGTGTTIWHNVYKVDYETYSKHTAPLKTDESTKEDYNTETKEIEEVTDADGKVSTKITKRSIQKVEKKERFKTDVFHEGKEVILEGDADFDVGHDTHSEIVSLLENPVLTMSAATTGITTNYYDLFFDEYYKNLGSHKFQLFTDKAQYFVTTSFSFYRTQGEGFLDFYKKRDNSNVIYPSTFQTTFQEETPIRSHTITAGTFSGVSVMGNFFTYFLVPNKPKFVEPYLTGQMTSFSQPAFISDADDGDEYIMQVVYEPIYTAFTGVVYTYHISKEDTVLSEEEILGSESTDWGKTKERVDTVRKLTFPIKPGRQFWYRVGNAKTLTNLFGVKQYVVTFSDIETAITASAPLSNFVQVESDSPYIKEIAGLLTPSYLGSLTSDIYSLSGVVYGSTVTGATMQLILPNGSYMTQTTDMTGMYNFTELDSGVYTLNTYYRGYQQDSRTVSITGNTSLSFKMKLLWGNDYDTWGKMAGENYFL